MYTRRYNSSIGYSCMNSAVFIQWQLSQKNVERCKTDWRFFLAVAAVGASRHFSDIFPEISPKQSRLSPRIVFTDLFSDFFPNLFPQRFLHASRDSASPLPAPETARARSERPPPRVVRGGARFRRFRPFCSPNHWPIVSTNSRRNFWRSLWRSRSQFFWRWRWPPGSARGLGPRAVFAVNKKKSVRQPPEVGRCEISLTGGAWRTTGTRGKGVE